MIHHKAGKINKGADALSMRYVLLSTLESKVLGFLCVELYPKDKDFKGILEKCSNQDHNLFHLENGFLFNGTRLCILQCGLKEHLIQVLHRRALAGHFCVEKTCLTLE